MYIIFVVKMSIVLEYIWLGGGNELRSKTRVLQWDLSSLDSKPFTIGDVPDWDYDGSSTNQATTASSEVILKPKALYKNPLRKGTNGYLVLCAIYNSEGQPLSFRDSAVTIFNQALEELPWYGIEQEYFIYDATTNEPLGYNTGCQQGQYYCSNGALNAFGRHIAEEHMEMCIQAGLTISGINAEVAPGQWEYQIGPCLGIESGDQLWISRFLLERVSEKYNVYINYGPKPIDSLNGSGCHTNFSTETMRNPGGLDKIYEAIGLLEKAHESHMKVYGQDNERRLIGIHETSSYDKFVSGKADRSASIRIGNNTIKNGCGYFEDRRPAANMDPYLVTSYIFRTCCLDK
jgi:glutamine synthetase